jgi:hypothetical protein
MSKNKTNVRIDQSYYDLKKKCASFHIIDRYICVYLIFVSDFAITIISQCVAYIQIKMVMTKGEKKKKIKNKKKQ